jgi:hypothetical protein
MKKDLLYSLVLCLISTPLLHVQSVQADPESEKAEAQVMLRVVKAKPLQSKTFRAGMITSTSPNKRFQQVADQVNQGNKPAPEKPAPTAITPIVNTVNDIQGRALNLGTDVVAFTLSPLPIHLERTQAEYVRDRTFEVLTNSHVQLYKAQW